MDPDYVAAKLLVAVAEVPVEPAEPMVLGMVAGIDLVLEVDSNLNCKHWDSLIHWWNLPVQLGESLAVVSAEFVEFAVSSVAESPKDSAFAVYAVAYTALPRYSVLESCSCNLKNLTVEIPFVAVAVVVADHNSNFAEWIVGSYIRYLFDWQD